MSKQRQVDGVMGVSVLMSVYKKEKPEYLQAAFESILSQTMLPDEIVLIEDGPLTEELTEVIENIKKRYKNLQIGRFEKNVQLGRALAKGVELCRHELVARMDTDDIAVKNRLELQYRYMTEHPEVDVCGGFIEEFHNEDPSDSRIKEMPLSGEDILKYSRFRNPMNHVTVMFRREAVLAAGNYRHFPYLEDYDLWLRMLAQKKCLVNLQQVMVKVRVGEGMYARRGGLDYCCRYLLLRKQQHEWKLLSNWEYLSTSILTIGITVAPKWLRKMAYKKVLRR